MNVTEENKGIKSSMRLSLLCIIGVAIIAVLTTCAAIIIQVLGKEQVDWVGLAAFIGALGAFTAPALGFKAYQKGKEKV